MHASIIRVQVERGEIGRARASLVGAQRSGMPTQKLALYQALVTAAGGDIQTAERTLESIPADTYQNDPTLASVVAWTRRLLSQQH